MGPTRAGLSYTWVLLAACYSSCPRAVLALAHGGLSHERGNKATAGHVQAQLSDHVPLPDTACLPPPTHRASSPDRTHKGMGVQSRRVREEEGGTDKTKRESSLDGRSVGLEVAADTEILKWQAPNADHKICVWLR
jgi:hypothetical protein